MEDFVSYEIALKLKEKGFSLNKEYIEFIGYRLIFFDECTIKRISTIAAYEKEYFGENIDCPTISQVLKWLRKKYSIHISTKPYACENGLMWMYEIRIFNKRIVFVVANKIGFVEAEESLLAGMEYVIDKLI